ncbi:MAG: DUF4339 domain-containing protein [Chlamydiia bacterium]|nr:DUF4339 domain-containing protein [Chlamydiia bacterium]
MDLNTMRLGVACLAGLLTGYLARQSGKNGMKWFFIGALFGYLLLPIFFFPFGQKKQRRKRAPKKVYSIEGPAHKFWYYIDPSQNQLGPMSYSALVNAWKEGKIGPATYVWHEELPEWKPLQELIQITKML